MSWHEELQQAILDNNLDLIKYIIKLQDVDISKELKYKDTTYKSFASFAEGQHKRSSAKILRRHMAIIKYRDYFIGNNKSELAVLHIMLREKDGDAIKEYLEKLDDDQAQEEALKPDPKGWTPLQIAVYYNDGDAVKAIINALGDQAQNEALKADPHGFKPLERAAYDNDGIAVQAILDALGDQAKEEAKNIGATGFRPLELAVRHNDGVAVKAILEVLGPKEAQKQIAEDGLYQRACDYNDKLAIKAILTVQQAQKDLSSVKEQALKNYPPLTELQFAARHCDGKAVTKILEKLGNQTKKEIENLDTYGWTPLQLAKTYHDEEAGIILLLEDIYQYFPGPEKEFSADQADRFVNFNALWHALKNAEEITAFITQAQGDFASKKHFGFFAGSQTYLDKIMLLNEAVEANPPKKTINIACILFEELLHKRKDYRLDKKNLNRLDLLKQINKDSQPAKKGSIQTDKNDKTNPFRRL